MDPGFVMMAVTACGLVVGIAVSRVMFLMCEGESYEFPLSTLVGTIVGCSATAVLHGLIEGQVWAKAVAALFGIAIVLIAAVTAFQTITDKD